MIGDCLAVRFTIVVWCWPPLMDVAVKQTAELFVGNVRADRRASRMRAQRVRNCGDVAVKQTAELFVGNVRADRRASRMRAQRVRNCGAVAVKQTAELFVGNVRADRRAGQPRAKRIHNCRTSWPGEAGLRGSELINELTARHISV
ncbi:hypothetical protein BW07_10050 [Bifidobacterium sp. UTCIF-36]|nr:hypothetical protein BW07_10050 [Bifidobacterium sp. UTCIF-36]